MFVKGKQKVVAYYDENGGKIIAEAKRLCQMREYEKALYTILAIPDCSKYAEEATAEAIKIYDVFNCSTMPPERISMVLEYLEYLEKYGYLSISKES